MSDSYYMVGFVSDSFARQVYTLFIKPSLNHH